MTENKRFEVHKVIGSFHEWSIEDTFDDEVVFGSIMHKYNADRLCTKLNELNDENEQLKQEIKELQGKASSWKITASEEMMKQSELMKENEKLKKVINEADDLIKSHLTNHYKTKWKHICEYYGVDIE